MFTQSSPTFSPAPSLVIVFGLHFYLRTSELNFFRGQPDWTVQDVLDFLETCRSKFGSKVDSYRYVFSSIHEIKPFYLLIVFLGQANGD
jgi:hypothetical protein